MIFYPHAHPSWEERQGFVEPISTPDDLHRAIASLAHRLAARLEARRLGAHAYSASFLRVDGLAPEIAIATSGPLRDPARVARLLGEKLEQVDPGFGIEAVVLLAGGIAPLRAVQHRLDQARTLPQAELSELLDQLANRLGLAALWQDVPRASHVPERSVQRDARLDVRVTWTQGGPERPLRLLATPEPVDVTALVPDDPPIQFRWRGALHRTRAASLPERIAVEWWRRTPDELRPEHDLLRDYYRVENTDGARFWLFRTGLHRPGAGSRWFLHGVFG